MSTLFRSALLLALALSLAARTARADSPRKPKTAEEIAAFGKTMLDNGHPEAAIAFFEEAVAIKPSYTDAYEWLGDSYALCGRSAKAVEAYEKFLALAPHDPRARDVSKFVQDHRPAATSKSIKSG